MTTVQPERGSESGSMMVEASSELDPYGNRIINQSGMPTSSLVETTQFREVAAQLSRWVDNGRAAAARTSMFDRGAYTPPENPYDEMRAARNAVKFDSIVSGVAEVTESFAFQGVKWESPDPDEADAFNQLATDQNLDAVVRAMWREEYTYAQTIVAGLWGWAEYTVRGSSKAGNKRKKTYRIWAPLQLKILDPCKVVPVGIGALGGEMLAWSATEGEIGSYQASVEGTVIDPLMLSFFTGTYQPGVEETRELARYGVDPSTLLVMNPDWVFRHTLTKPDYERFPDNRLKSCFRLLDMKQALMASDRANLIGAANYILLIRKGSKEQPAQPEEMQALKENYNYLAKMPVIIADHRLDIEIIAPKTDFTLVIDKYNTLDTKLTQRLLGTLSGGRSSGSRESPEASVSQSVGRVMENRRHMLRRTLENRIARAVVRHPKNKGVFQYEPNLVYTPRNIALAEQAGYLQSLLALRTQRELSRETILEVFGLDEETEAMRMQMEAEMFDDIFKTEIPYSAGSPAAGVDSALDKKDAPAAVTVDPDGTLKVAPGSGTPNSKAPVKAPAKAPVKAAPGKIAGSVKTTSGAPESPKVSGGRGGRPVGGGNSTGSPAAIAKPRTRSGNPSTK